MGLTINGQQIQVQGIRPLRPGISIEQAVQKTKNNGLDEIFFTSNGRSYVAYGDSLNMSGLRKNAIPAVMFKGQSADVVAYDDEINGVWEGARKGAVDEIKTGMNAVRSAVGNLITTVQPTVAVVGGIGIAGMGVYQLWRGSQGAIGVSMAASGSAAGVGAGSWIVDALKGSVVGGLKIAAISGGVGLAILGGYGAIRGALEARNTSKDLASIASITEEGSSPTNGGQALGWSELNPPGTAPGLPTNTPPMDSNPGFVPSPGMGNSPVSIGLPSYGSPVFFQQPAVSGSVGQSVSGLMSPQQLISSQVRR